MSEKIKCKYCGKVISKINLKDHEENWCSKSPKIKGIDGWMGLFAFGLYISAIVLLYYSLTIGVLFFNIIFLLTFGYFIYLIYLMHKRSKDFKKLVIWGLWIWVPIIVIEVVYFMVVLTGEQFTQWINLLFSEGLSSLISGVVGSLIWTEYILKSKRVKNTFTK